MSEVFARLTFGIVPAASEEDTRVLLSDFCARLGKEIGSIVLPHRAPSPAALASAMQMGRVQVAWISPTLLVTSKLLEGVVPLASSVREGHAFFHAALFVDERSTVVRVDDLAGKRAAWVAPTSASGYLFSRVKLAQRGLDPRALFAAESFCDSHGAVARAVFEGRADVGATFAVFEGGDPSRPLLQAGFSGVGRARVLDVAGPIPADVIVAIPGMAATMRSRIAVALQTMTSEQDSRALTGALFGVDGFAPFSAGALQSLRGLVATARTLGFLES